MMVTAQPSGPCCGRAAPIVWAAPSRRAARSERPASTSALRSGGSIERGELPSRIPARKPNSAAARLVPGSKASAVWIAMPRLALADCSALAVSSISVGATARAGAARVGPEGAAAASRGSGAATAVILS
jgi:hypothetical protein